MPAKLLIVDSITTNRVVLRLKLRQASYQVSQAADGAEGLAEARRLQPDLVLCSARLPDMSAGEFAKALRDDPRCRAASVIVESVSRDESLRYDLLASGADDILLKPYDDRLLLARLRSLLRLHETSDELRLREGASQALGLSDPGEEFARPGRIALMAADTDAVRGLAHALACELARDADRGPRDWRPGQMSAMPFREALRRIDPTAAPDVVAMQLTSTSAETGLQLLADLRAKAETRDTGILVLIDGPDAQRLAADALDRGANDVITEPTSPREIALRLGRQITRKHRLDRLRTKMRDGLQAALIDPMTGLFNRRYAMPHMVAMAETTREDGRDFAAMVIDVDHFKLINDRFGHAAGDTVLMHLADLLRDSVDDDALLARIGGEEFLIALAGNDQDNVRRRAHDICDRVQNTPFPIPGRDRPLQLTVSIGVALMSDIASSPGRTAPQSGTAPSPRYDPMQRCEALLDQADKALYGAKALGRNRVTLSTARSAA